MDGSSVLVEGPDPSGVLWLTLARSRAANALDRELVAQVLSTLERAAVPEVRLVAITGDRKNFSGGFDLRISGQSKEHLAFRFIEIELMLEYLRSAPFVTVACIAGAAYGAGADLALACDYRIGSKDSRFRFPGPRFGISLGNNHLIRIAGPARARDLLLTARVVDAEEAFRFGLLTHVVGDHADCRAVVVELAEKLADLTIEDIRRILAVTRAPSQDADLVSLVRSVAAAELPARLEAYLAAARRMATGEKST